ncbi:hypothetical protein PINS_up000653 [Pythium insidiosum]|nr:hypothetical protein PINS_up000653 [Pythium insidiosum]
MGQLGRAFGLEKKGKIGLTVDKPSYIAGELVVGTIYLSVFEPIECDGTWMSMVAAVWIRLLRPRLHLAQR